MSSYKEYAGLANENLNRAANLLGESDPQIAIANAQVFALLAVAEAILAASGQND